MHARDGREAVGRADRVSVLRPRSDEGTAWLVALEMVRRLRRDRADMVVTVKLSQERRKRRGEGERGRRSTETTSNDKVTIKKLDHNKTKCKGTVDGPRETMG